MRYVIVNYRRPRGLPRFCAFCCEPIVDGYVRDLHVRLVYHSVGCLELHVSQSVLAIEDAARRVS